jgi:oxygen-independent coproporphyrinogen III oxidase
LLSRKLREAVVYSERLSADIHVPYCDKLCWFCGCHTKHTLSYDPIAKYIDVLVRGIESYAEVGQTRKVLSKFHLGGGSPSLLRRLELLKIRIALKKAYVISRKTEISIELDPSDLTARDVDDFIEFGLTRASVGVQDFDPEIQHAINRPQSFETTQNVVDKLRHAGVGSFNFDALYGLP